MKKIILVAETGSDIPKEIADRYGIEMVPMHVSFDTETLDDTTFPAQKIVDYYKETSKLPKTSGCTPGDFIDKFDEIHEKYPEAQILYLAYSAVTTCSYQSAIIASDDRDYITPIDTKQVSAGQANVVVKVAQYLEEHPEADMDDVVSFTNEIIERAKMCFMPDNLEFLRAGGRVSNAAYLGATLLGLHPCIEILEGKLMATKKYRGKMKKVAPQMIQEYAEKYKIDKNETLWLVYTIGLSDDVKEVIANELEVCGFTKVEWVQANAVITTHGGPGAFGFASFSER